MEQPKPLLERVQLLVQDLRRAGENSPHVVSAQEVERLVRLHVPEVLTGPNEQP